MLLCVGMERAVKPRADTSFTEFVDNFSVVAFPFRRQIAQKVGVGVGCAYDAATAPILNQLVEGAFDNHTTHKALPAAPRVVELHGCVGRIATSRGTEIWWLHSPPQRTRVHLGWQVRFPSALRCDDRQNALNQHLRLLRERRLDYSSEDTVPLVGVGRTSCRDE